MNAGAIPFLKMHGLGNDFVVIDARGSMPPWDAGRIRAVADRRTGVGCDQLIILEPGPDGADVFMRIHNADGGEVEACGNAARCIGRLLMEETGRDQARIATASGTVTAGRAGGGGITIDMGRPGLDWQDIPLAKPCDTLRIPLARDGLAEPVGVSMGNPHALFFVADAEAVPLETVGPALEHDPIFPERANIGIVQAEDRHRLRYRVWERGVGITRACGTGACAAVVAAVRRGLGARQATVILDGGSLDIVWRDDDHVLMTGPAALSFRGGLDPSVLSR